VDWEISDSSIVIRKGGTVSGCVSIGMIVLAAGFVVLALTWHFRIDIPELEYELPIVVFLGCFGLFVLAAAIQSRRGQSESVVTIDIGSEELRFDPGTGERAVVIPLSQFVSSVLWERLIERTQHQSVHSRHSGTPRVIRDYSYHLYLIEADGSIFWLDTFETNQEAHDRLEGLLDRLEISCIDEAGGSLSRQVEPQTVAETRTRDFGEFSDYARVTDRGVGSVDIALRYEQYGARGLFRVLLMVAVFVGCPVWLFIANYPVLDAWFLIFPAVPLLFVLVGLFLRGRRYDIACRSEEVRLSVHFLFPLFEWFFGRSLTIPTSELKAVRVNRYDDDEFHLEIGVNGEFPIPRSSRIAFNSGAVRTLPRKVVPDDIVHIGLWSVMPMKRGAGPTVSDLYRIEEIMESRYRLECG